MKRLYLTFLLLTTSLFAQLTFTQYTTDDGLCDNRCRAIAVDSTGNIWTGGWPGPIYESGGVSCFDKEQGEWHTWSTYTTDWNLSNNHISDIQVDRDNTVWVVTGVNVWFGDPADTNKIPCFYRDGEWNRFDHRYGLPEFWYREMHFDYDGRLWLTSDRGADCYNGTSWFRLDMSDGLREYPYLYHVVVDQDSVLWFAFGSFDDDPHVLRIYSYEDHLVEHVIDSISPISNINHLRISPDNNIWICTSRGFYVYDRSTFHHYLSRDDDDTGRIYDVGFDSSGLAWLLKYNTYVGCDLVLYNGTSFTSVDSLYGIPFELYHKPYELVIDEEDTKWIATDGHGIISIEGSVSGLDETPITSSLALNAYPNPFNSSCRMETAEDAEIEIFDIRGNLVQKLDNTDVFTPTEDTPSGVYLVRARTQKEAITKKIHFVK